MREGRKGDPPNEMGGLPLRPAVGGAAKFDRCPTSIKTPELCLPIRVLNTFEISRRVTFSPTGEDEMKKMIAVATLLLPSMGSAAAQDASEFYKNKTVNIIVGFSSGGGYDLYARLLSRHFGKFAAGSPTFVVQNMPGAGSLTAVRSLDARFPQDGTAIVAFNPGLITESLVNPERTKVSFTDVAWLGSTSRDFRVCYAWAATGIKTWEDVKNQKEFIVGVTAPGSSSYINSATLRSVFGLNVKQVAGYPGSAETRLAIERGELHGDCGTWSAITPEWREQKKGGSDLIACA